MADSVLCAGPLPSRSTNTALCLVGGSKHEHYLQSVTRENWGMAFPYSHRKENRAICEKGQGAPSTPPRPLLITKGFAFQVLSQSRSF